MYYELGFRNGTWIEFIWLTQAFCDLFSFIFRFHYKIKFQQNKFELGRWSGGGSGSGVSENVEMIRILFVVLESILSVCLKPFATVFMWSQFQICTPRLIFKIMSSHCQAIWRKWSQLCSGKSNLSPPAINQFARLLSTDNESSKWKKRWAPKREDPKEHLVNYTKHTMI